MIDGYFINPEGNLGHPVAYTLNLTHKHTYTNHSRKTIHIWRTCSQGVRCIQILYRYETRGNQVRREETRGDQMRPEETRGDERRPEETRGDERRREETRGNQVRREETRGDQVRGGGERR